MGNLSEKLHLAPDILGNTTVVNLYGKEMALVENYQSIIKPVYSKTRTADNQFVVSSL